MPLTVLPVAAQLVVLAATASLGTAQLVTEQAVRNRAAGTLTAGQAYLETASRAPAVQIAPS